MLPIDDQDRIIAGLVPQSFEDSEREIIKAAYAVATYWHASQRSLDFATFVIAWVACLGVQSTRPPSRS